MGLRRLQPLSRVRCNRPRRQRHVPFKAAQILDRVDVVCGLDDLRREAESLGDADRVGKYMVRSPLEPLEQPRLRSTQTNQVVPAIISGAEHDVAGAAQSVSSCFQVRDGQQRNVRADQNRRRAVTIDQQLLECRMHPLTEIVTALRPQHETSTRQRSDLTRRFVRREEDEPLDFVERRHDVKGVGEERRPQRSKARVGEMRSEATLARRRRCTRDYTDRRTGSGAFFHVTVACALDHHTRKRRSVATTTPYASGRRTSALTSHQ